MPIQRETTLRNRDDELQRYQGIERLLNNRRIKLTFPTALEKKFQADYSDRYHLLVLLGFVLGSSLFLLSTVVDILFSSNMGPLLIIRFAYVAPIVVLCYLTLVFARKQHIVEQITVLCGVIAIIVGILTCAYYEIAQMKIMYYCAIFLVLIYLGAPTYIRFWSASIVTVVTFVLYNVFLYIDSHTTVYFYFTYNYLYVGGAIMALLSNYFAERFRRQQYLRSMLIEKEREYITHIARHDDLTGLPNRNLFNYTLQNAINRAKHSKNNLALLYLDLDNFKDINDTLGHDIGNLLLVRVGQRLENSIRKNDFVARLGGDEFAVIISGLTSRNIRQHVNKIAAKINSSIRRSYKLMHYNVDTSISIGVAYYPHDGKDAISLVKNADIALYAAKAAGRNTYKYFTTSLARENLEYVNIENSLHNALKKCELFLVYQPKYQLPSKQIIGVEVLLRWRHPSLGLLYPGKFIPIAEVTGIIDIIGKWILRCSCKQYMRWLQDGVISSNFSMSVNLSPYQLADKSLVTVVHNILNKNSMNPKNLDLELTEGAIMRDPKKAGAILKRLHDMGITISVDDFGTGYSSLSYLKFLPLDNIKIDQSFIHDMVHDKYTATIVESIIILAKNLKLNIIAEGVETEQQLQLLINHKCPQAQGFYLSKPLTADGLTVLLKNS